VDVHQDEVPGAASPVEVVLLDRTGPGTVLRRQLTFSGEHAAPPPGKNAPPDPPARPEEPP
jgi:hypothetical protein